MFLNLATVQPFFFYLMGVSCYTPEYCISMAMASVILGEAIIHIIFIYKYVDKKIISNIADNKVLRET